MRLAKYGNSCYTTISNGGFSMNIGTRLISAPFIALFVYYFGAILWSLIYSVLAQDFSAFSVMLPFWKKTENVGFIIGRISCWFIAFGAGCSVFFMDNE